MIKDFNIKTIDDTEIYNKTILLRVDFNVAQNQDLSISDDERIVQALPTIKQLLKNNNKFILISHLGQPKMRDYKFSLKNVGHRLQSYIKDKEVILVHDFLTPEGHQLLKKQTSDQILLLENIRFYKEEKENNTEFAKNLASIADIFVNDAFGVCHRTDASVVSIPEYLPSYAGLLLKKEIESLEKVIKHPQKPLVAIIGGAKIKTKINLLEKLMEIADFILVGGALANNFLKAKGIEIGKSLYDPEEIETAKRLLSIASEKSVSFYLPKDVMLADMHNPDIKSKFVKLDEIDPQLAIVDVGPETEAEFGSIISQAKTIIWNGPIGYCENDMYCLGTEFLYYSITQNQNAFSVVGGGDTLAAISKEEYIDKISHLSTGGGAMLEFIEKGTLPGLEALKN